MNIEIRNDLIKNFFEQKCCPILEQKGTASAGASDDANKNFKEATGKNIDEIHAWWIYYIKHVIRIKDFVFNRQIRMEAIEETIADLVNYPLILYTILIEKKIIKEKENTKIKIKKDTDKLSKEEIENIKKALKSRTLENEQQK